MRPCIETPERARSTNPTLGSLLFTYIQFKWATFATHDTPGFLTASGVSAMQTSEKDQIRISYLKIFSIRQAGHLLIGDLEQFACGLLLETILRLPFNFYCKMLQWFAIFPFCYATMLIVYKVNFSVYSLIKFPMKISTSVDSVTSKRTVCKPLKSYYVPIALLFE